MLEKRQALEERVSFEQEEFCLELEAEMARISKGERALAAENQQRREPLLR